MAAVLLRRLFTSTFEEFWPEVAPDLQQQVKDEMLRAVQQEENALVRKKICDATAELARNMLGRMWILCLWVIAGLHKVGDSED